jgi:PhnB protein
MSTAKSPPHGYHSVTPYLIVDGADEAIDFYKKAFGAKEEMRLPGPGGRIGHAEIRIGDSPIMLADEHPDMDIFGPKMHGGSAVSLLIYVDDCDRVIDRAVEAGASLKRPPADQFYGDRSGTVEDPFGHSWHVHTRLREVSEAEVRKGAAARAKQADAG